MEADGLARRLSFIEHCVLTPGNVLHASNYLRHWSVYDC